MKKSLFEKGIVYLLKVVISYFFYIKDRVEFYLNYIFKKNKFVTFLPISLTNKKKVVAIFSIYQPKGLSFIIKRSINYLLKNNIKIILVAPHPLINEEIEFLRDKDCTVLIRSNIGRDFGSYQCGVFYLLNNKELLDSTEKILLVNDSIIFPIKDQDNNLQKILNFPEKVIGLTESYHSHWHICSYFILLHKDIFLNSEIQRFWKIFKPYSSRFHVIYKGEIAFGKIIQKITSDYRIIYDGSVFLNAITHFNLIKKDPNFEKLFNENIAGNSSLLTDSFFHKETLDLRKISYIIEKYSILHIFPLILIYYLNCFFIKKDVCYRGFFSLSYFVNQVSKFNDDEQFVEQIRNELKAKGLPKTDTLLKRVLHITGAI